MFDPNKPTQGHHARKSLLKPIVSPKPGEIVAVTCECVTVTTEHWRLHFELQGADGELVVGDRVMVEFTHAGIRAIHARGQTYFPNGH